MFDKNPEDILDWWLDFEDYCSNGVSILDRRKQDQLRIHGGQAYRATEFSYCSSTAMGDRKFIMTNAGLIGVGPKCARPGDTVVIFAGSETPFVLRLVEETPSQLYENGANISGEDADAAGLPDRWELIGDCYLHGFMEKQSLRSKLDDKKDTFSLI
jgi:hypothetical protein